MPRKLNNVPSAAGHRASPSLLIEGWRGINHSFALVNQRQILELLRLPELRLYHRDMPYHLDGWSRSTHSSGLSTEELGLIDGLPDPRDEEDVDCVYRICSPFRPGAVNDRRKRVTYLITELGPTREDIETGSAADFTRDQSFIVTGTAWSRDRLVEWGFAADKIEVVPHGVDAATFCPLTAAERQETRHALGITEDETLFLNVGAALWNKGVDLLLLAFARLRASGRKFRLILRDRADVYGLTVGDFVRELEASNPGLFGSGTLEGIMVADQNLSIDHLRRLYGAADCYVSPYRAEGFNLPVLEAIACGTPVIVTRGGATDDFCDDDVAIRVTGSPGQFEDAETGVVRRFINPSPRDVADAMDSIARQTRRTPQFEQARARVVEKFSWRNAAAHLARLTVGYEQH